MPLWWGVAGAKGVGIWGPHGEHFTPFQYWPLIPRGRGWIISFITQSPAVLDNSTKEQATQNIFVTNMGKLRAWFSTPPVLSFLLSILLFVVTPSYPFFCLFSLQASLVLSDSPSFTHSGSLPPPKFSCVFRKQLSDEEALRCAIAWHCPGWGVPQVLGHSRSPAKGLQVGFELALSWLQVGFAMF